MTTHARTKRSNEIPGGALPGIAGALACCTSTPNGGDESQGRSHAGSQAGGGTRGARTIFPLEEVQQRGREVVPELRQGLLQLVPVDGPRAVAVEVAEDILPVFDVLPEAGELCVVLARGDWEGEMAGRTSLKPMLPLRSVS